MSIYALTWAFEQSIAPLDKLILLCLANYADERGHVDGLRLTRLVEETGLRADEILARLKALVTWDAIVEADVIIDATGDPATSRLRARLWRSPS